MPIHNKVTVRSLFVLANPRLNQRGISQCWKPEADILANPLQCRRANNSLAFRRIESFASRVVGYLKTPALISRYAVEESFPMIAPHRKLRVGESRIPGGRDNENNVPLLCFANALQR